MVVLNLTEEQTKRALTEPSIFDNIIHQPIFWSLLICVIVFLIYKSFFDKGAKADPSTKPWYGRLLLKDLLHKETKKRMDTFGRKPSIRAEIEKGVSRIGVVTKIEHDKVLFYKTIVDPKTGKRNYQADFYYRVDRFEFRKHGIFGWLLALGGLNVQYICVTPDSYKVRRDNRGMFLFGSNKKPLPIIFSIDPSVHLLNDSDVWTCSKTQALEANKELIIKADMENQQGSALDFLRRLAVHSPVLAGQMEKMSHEAMLKEEERKRKTAPYS